MVKGGGGGSVRAGVRNIIRYMASALISVALAFELVVGITSIILGHGGVRLAQVLFRYSITRYCPRIPLTRLL